jgi:hypothetical protein
MNENKRKTNLDLIEDLELKTAILVKRRNDLGEK